MGEKIGSRLTGVIFALLLIKSGLHFVPLQWTLVILIGAAGREYNGTLVLRLLVLGIVPLGDNCAFQNRRANEIRMEICARAKLSARVKKKNVRCEKRLMQATCDRARESEFIQSSPFIESPLGDEFTKIRGKRLHFRVAQA